MGQEPRRDDYTICTAIASDAVFTVRTYATTAPYEPRLVRTFRPDAEQNPRLATRNQGNTENVSKSGQVWETVNASKNRGSVTLGGQRVSMTRPRARTLDGTRCR